MMLSWGGTIFYDIDAILFHIVSIEALFPRERLNIMKLTDDLSKFESRDFFLQEIGFQFLFSPFISMVCSILC